MKLSAFVGHSFLPQDKEVVQKFLNFFDSLATEFSWENARDAKIGSVKSKIFNKIKNNDIFIGICTPHEIVIDENQLEHPWFSKTKYLIKERNFQKKTSDWLIQEIGIAVGMGKKIILLVEEGLEGLKGLLDGDEYIPFSRKYLPEAFLKINEMILDLKKNMDTRHQSKESIDEQKPKIPQAKEGLADFLNPKPNWEFQDYEFAIYASLTLEKGSIKSIFDAFDKSNLAKDASLKISLNAICLMRRFSIRQDNVITELKDLVRKNPGNTKAVECLATVYVEQNQPDQAVLILDKALSETDKKEDRIKILIYSAEILATKGDQLESEKKILEIESIKDLSKKERTSILKKRAEIAKLNEDNYLFCYLSEGVLHEDPDNDDLRFNLARGYQEIGYHALSVNHYKVLISKKPKEDCYQNNIGVAYSQIKIKGKATEAFQSSLELGGTLAASNLAYRLTNVGFFSKAEDICNKVIKKPLCDNSVVEALEFVKKQRKLEDEKEKEALKRVPKIVKSLVNFRAESLKPKLTNGRYVLSREKIEYDLVVDGNKVSGIYKFSYLEEPPFLLSLPKKRKDKIIEITGQVIGRAILFTEKEKGRLSTAFFIGGLKNRGILIFSENMETATYTYIPDLKIQIDTVKKYPQ